MVGVDDKLLCVCVCSAVSTDSVRVVRVDAHLRRHIIFVDTNNTVRCCLVNVGWMLVVTDFE